MIAPATQVVPDYTSLACANECARRFKYAYELGLAPLEPSVLLHAGSAGHTALEVLHKTEGNVESAVEALHSAWGDFQTPPGHKHSYLTPGHLEMVVRRFAREWEPDSWQVPGVEPEQVFRLDWDGIEIGGKIDHIEEAPGGIYYVKDYKFTTQWVNEWWAQQGGFNLGHQLRIYTWAARELTGLNVVGARIHGIYMGEKAADDDEKWDRRKSVPSMIFGPYTFSDAMLEETREWIEATLAEIEFRRGQNAWPQNTNNKYGCSKCSFYELCTSNPKIREAKMSSLYRERELTGILLSGADSDDG